ncbi:ATP-binding protein [Leptolyngbya sp. CCNP1308]|uniref:ATP-binding protein n=1 Tax=Leptolyngbya sp. CCNP1308 TaxID=3110255 RepID=UPI002B1F5306|nr:ATP-binding protein [Leptolyngbya sp. CCNP1308]MEA5451643.1 ATP-binding protein [Leptolyngbya sp. CCNP1308]
MRDRPDDKELAAVQSQVQPYRQRIDGLLFYRSVFDQPVGTAFLALLNALESGESALSLRAYGAWFKALATSEARWSDYLLRQIAYAENPFTLQAQRTDFAHLPAALVEAARHDLGTLQALYQLSSDTVAGWVQAIAQTPAAPIAWAVDETPPPPLVLPDDAPWADAVASLAHHYRRHGSGLLAQYRAFTWHQGQLCGIADPDPIRLGNLTAYDYPRQQLVQNTLALLKGYPALNVLLYGSRGVGKSSLVKALVNEYADQGLRLVEVAKADLRALPQIVGEVRACPQKFIIFVDDLSFEEDDDTFKALKVVLEGSTTARPANVVVYATSNRRHLVREYFSDRPRPSDQDEVQSWDTMQEKLSFSDRFGLTLTFEPADQPTYLAIVHHLAQQADIALTEDDLTARALQWATRHNGRSGRTARQFIDWLTADLGLAERSP